jgi:hypothetical protein
VPCCSFVAGVLAFCALTGTDSLPQSCCGSHCIIASAAAQYATARRALPSANSLQLPSMCSSSSAPGHDAPRVCFVDPESHTPCAPLPCCCCCLAERTAPGTALNDTDAPPFGSTTKAERRTSPPAAEPAGSPTMRWPTCRPLGGRCSPNSALRRAQSTRPQSL